MPIAPPGGLQGEISITVRFYYLFVSNTNNAMYSARYIYNGLETFTIFKIKPGLSWHSIFWGHWGAGHAIVLKCLD